MARINQGYDLEVHYHPGKANIVADAPGQKSHCDCLTTRPFDRTLCQEMEKLNLEIVQHGTLANITVESTIQIQIVAAQKGNKGIAHIKDRVMTGKAPHFQIDDEGVLCFKNHLVDQKFLSYVKKSSMKLTCLDFLFIQEVIRSIGI